MKANYREWKPKPETLIMVERSIEICTKFTEDGYSPTLRQLYYQHVARNWIPNSEASYKRLGEVISRARMAGMFDWDFIEDRTRNLEGRSHWEEPQDLLAALPNSIYHSRWKTNPTMVWPEVWVEKDALVNVVEVACDPLDVGYFACRGYVSQSEMHTAALRFRRRSQRGHTNIIFHLGDHDPSGIDMTRDIQERLTEFKARVEVIRIGLNMDQIEQYQPPPNPAKENDARFASYSQLYGDDSWELDALDPEVIDGLIRAAILPHLSVDHERDMQAEDDADRTILRKLHRKWDEVKEFLEEL